MGILPEILENIEVETTKKEVSKENFTYIVDFKNKKMKYYNSMPVIDNQELAIKMYIQKLLYTEINDWKHHKNYGTNYKQLTFGKKYSSLVNKIKIETNLKKQLLNYSDILSVNNLKIYQDYKTLKIEFSIILKNNKVLNWEEEIVL